jgi:hypothetical protein
MANHKKKRPLNRRGHCKMCKYWKINGMNRDNPDFERHSDHKRRMWAKIDAKETIEKGEE